MTAILRAALLAMLAVSSIPAVAVGQDTSAASLLRRIQLLELANADLTRRVRTLESLARNEPSQALSVPTSTQWRDMADWRRLRRGMSMDQVRALLGEPERVEAGMLTYWRWANARVVFMDDKLDGWSEPTSED